MKDCRKNFLWLLIVVSVAYLLITPVGVDMPFHVLRIGELGREISRGGGFPVYIYRDLYSHYGYPIPLFYCSLFLYPFATLTLVGIKAVTAYKLMTICVLWITYYVAVTCISQIPGYHGYRYEAALIYTVQPFFLNELFVRSSIGAACVFIFIPIILVGLYYISIGDKTGIIWLGGGMAGVVMSHVISAVLITFMVAVLTAIILIRSRALKRVIISVLCSAVVCILLSACYVFPVIEQLSQYVFKSQTAAWLRVGAENPISMLLPIHLVTALNHIFRTNLPISAIGGSVIPLLILTIILIVTGRIRHLRPVERALLIIYYSIVLLIMIQPVWNVFGDYIAFIQFGWRIFLIASIIGTVLCIILMTGASGEDHGSRVVMTISVCSAIYILVFFFGYYAVRNIAPGIVSETVGHSIDTYEYTTETDDDLYIPAQMDELSLADRLREVKVIQYESITETSPEYTYSLDEETGAVRLSVTDNHSDTDTVFEVPFIMYEGYTARNSTTGETYRVCADDDGFVSVIIPSGSTGEVDISYTGTVIQRISLYLSLISILMIIGLVLYHRKRMI